LTLNGIGIGTGTYITGGPKNQPKIHTIEDEKRLVRRTIILTAAYFFLPPLSFSCRLSVIPGVML